MQTLPLSSAAERLNHQLEAADAVSQPDGQKFHVAGLGQAFYFAYEQLRNVAEYREHHLLLRGAIERYLRRYTRLDHYEPAAADLVTELTQAGYLKNDSIPMTTIEAVDKHLQTYATMYQALHATMRLGRDTTAKWFQQIASVQIETLLSPDPRGAVVMQFAYEHYFHAIDASVKPKDLSDQKYRIALFCAVQRAIFKSDIATTRYYCVSMTLPNLVHQPIQHFVELNQQIDELYQAPLTNRIFRLINRYGAPMRILRKLIMEGVPLKKLLASRSDTLSRVKALCAQEYNDMQKHLSGRIAKTILFIFITKTLLGMAFEVPYDLFVHGAISWLPLIANICFPVLYMVMIGARIAPPGRHNTEVIAGYVDRILFNNPDTSPVVYKPKRRVASKSLNRVFSGVYAIAFIGSLALLLEILRRLHFNIANGLIFFVFLSAVSFLGFRLRQSANELQMLDERQGVLQAIIDFLSTPFVRIGHWLSDKYAKANIVTTVLDLAIEMPLKTTLRLMRQWVGFLRDKQEEL